jgi:hypothetical protein
VIVVVFVVGTILLVTHWSALLTVIGIAEQYF